MPGRVCSDEHAGTADEHAGAADGDADEHTGAADVDEYAGAADRDAHEHAGAADCHAHEHAGAADCDSHEHARTADRDADEHAGAADGHADEHAGTADRDADEHASAADVDEYAGPADRYANEYVYSVAGWPSRLTSVCERGRRRGPGQPGPRRFHASTRPRAWPTIAAMLPHETVRARLEERERLLAPAAMRVADTRGRARPEKPPNMRTEYQRDRDRIIHSKAFRRLKHKTQVFIAPLGDHYVTRLTHTLEVAQVARTIARALNLNEDLTEAIALGHDLGHTPFGHAGEQALGNLLPEGFRHNEQSVRIVDLLEASGAGLNLTWEVREGILKHSKPREGIFSELEERHWAADEWGDPLSTTLEGQIVRLSDSVAYLNHDIADAVRAGLLRTDDLPREARRVLGETHSERIDALVTDIVDASWDAAAVRRTSAGASAPIVMSAEVAAATDELRDYLFENVYLWEERLAEADRARRVIEFLWQYFLAHPEEVAASEYTRPDDPLARRIADYIAGMTDQFAIQAAARLGFAS